MRYTFGKPFWALEELNITAERKKTSEYPVQM